MEKFVVLCDFKANIVNYWVYLYGLFILVGVIWLIVWMGDIMALLKKDAKAGKESLWTWALAAGLFFGVSPFLSEIMRFFNISVPNIF
jgi:hypothetical protein